METEIKAPPLQKEWEERKRLRKEGKRLWLKGNLLYHRIRIKKKPITEKAAAYKLCTKGHNLFKEGYMLWNDVVERYYGKDAKVKWRKWHEDNDMTCHINGDVYI